MPPQHPLEQGKSGFFREPPALPPSFFNPHWPNEPPHRLLDCHGICKIFPPRACPESSLVIRSATLHVCSSKSMQFYDTFFLPPLSIRTIFGKESPLGIEMPSYVRIRDGRSFPSARFWQMGALPMRIRVFADPPPPVKAFWRLPFSPVSYAEGCSGGVIFLNVTPPFSSALAVVRCAFVLTLRPASQRKPRSGVILFPLRCCCAPNALSPCPAIHSLFHALNRLPPEGFSVTCPEL